MPRPARAGSDTVTGAKAEVLVLGFPAVAGEELARGLRAEGLAPRDGGRGAVALEGVEAVVVCAEAREGVVTLAARVRAEAPLVPVVVVAAISPAPALLLDLGRARVRDVVVARAGADAPEVARRIAAAVEHGRRRRAPEAPGTRLVGSSQRMEQVRRWLRRAATSTANVLLLGETGTGKELAARAIHEGSARRDGPFVAVNCSGFAESLLESELFGHERGAFTGADRQRRGAFEIAHGGTLFLDEVGEMPLAFQSKLLRVLAPPPGERETVREIRRVGGEAATRSDVRVVAATNAELERMVETGGFRKDLLERLDVIRILLPALRDRLSDVPELVASTLARIARETGAEPLGIDPLALQALGAYGWPNNVRELEGTLRSVVATKETGDAIRLGDLPPKVFERRAEPAPGETPLASLAEIEAAHVARVLEAVGRNKARAARILGVSRPRLDRLLVRHGLAGTRR